MANILVVDDDNYVREMLCLSLRCDSHQVNHASDGAQALSYLTQFVPDILITDIVMPNLDGMELIDNIKQEYPEVKIIAISGGAREGAGDRLVEAKAKGADVTLEKPFQRDELKQAIDELL